MILYVRTNIFYAHIYLYTNNSHGRGLRYKILVNVVLGLFDLLPRNLKTERRKKRTVDLKALLEN